MATGLATSSASNRLLGTIYGLGAGAIWGGVYVVSDELLKVVSPFTLLTMRFALGLVVLAASLAAQGKLIIPIRDAVRLAIVGIVGFGISVGAQFVATDLSTSMNTVVITSASPVFALVFAWLILREKLSVVRFVAVGIALVGVLFVLDLSQFDLRSEVLVGNLVAVFAAVTWALYSVLVRRVSRNFGTLTITCYVALGGLIMATPLALAELATTPVPPLNVNHLLGVAYLGIVATALSTWLWNRAFALVEAGIASLFIFAQPLVGVILSAVLLDQPITAGLLLGGALIAAGVFLSLRAG
jgi:drug/metabolite transporter (DMT)-like permease